MRHLAAASDYKKIMETLQSMESAWDGEDETLNNLQDNYEPEYILYLDAESRKLAEAGNQKEAVNMLEEAKAFVDDYQAVENLIMDIQSGVIGENILFLIAIAAILQKVTSRTCLLERLIMQKMRYMPDMEENSSLRSCRIILIVNPGIEKS